MVENNIFLHAFHETDKLLLIKSTKQGNSSIFEPIISGFKSSTSNGGLLKIEASAMGRSVQFHGVGFGPFSKKLAVKYILHMYAICICGHRNLTNLNPTTTTRLA